MGLKIDVLCPSGSPIGVVPADIYDRGIGGAELALLSWAEEMARREHRVTIYNDPRDRQDYRGVQYRPINEYNHADERDVMILFRCPHHTFSAARGLRVFWSCDQYTIGNYNSEIFPYAHKIVCISNFHQEYFRVQYGLKKDRSTVIRLGVRAEDYVDARTIPKIKNRMIYCSVPGRGLDQLARMWPTIKERIPDASLVITSDYRLWGLPTAQNQEYRLMLADQPDVIFLGKIPRLDMCRHQKEADVQAYPCTYEELNCISVAECQVGGAVPITSDVGAVDETNVYGQKVNGMPGQGNFNSRFIDKLHLMCVERRDILEKARELSYNSLRGEFNWTAIAVQWEELFNDRN